MPLTIKIEGQEWVDNKTMEFHSTEPTTLVLEHSLISISKWEAKWKKSYIDSPEKTNEELYDYIRCMNIKGDVDIDVVKRITKEDYLKVIDYISDSMSATIIAKPNLSNNKEQFVTSELIYAWMANLGIDFSCEKWHISRLLKLIAVCSELNKEPEKLSPKEAVKRQREINERNKKKFAAKKR